MHTMTTVVAPRWLIKSNPDPVSSLCSAIHFQHSRPLGSAPSPSRRHFTSISHTNPIHARSRILRFCVVEFIDVLLLRLQLESAIRVLSLVVVLVAHDVFLYFCLIVKTSVLGQRVGILQGIELQRDYGVRAMHNHSVLETTGLESLRIVIQVSDLNDEREEAA